MMMVMMSISHDDGDDDDDLCEQKNVWCCALHVCVLISSANKNLYLQQMNINANVGRKITEN